MDNSEIIEKFSIRSADWPLPRILFKSDEKTAITVREGMIISSDYWEDIQLSFHNYPEVHTRIYTKGKPDIEKFLAINSVRKAFEWSEFKTPLPTNL